MWIPSLALLLCKLPHLDFSLQNVFLTRAFDWSNLVWYGKLMMARCGRRRLYVLLAGAGSFHEVWRSSWDVREDSEAFTRCWSQSSSSLISSLFHFATLVLLVSIRFGHAWEKVYFAQSYNCLLLTGLEHMTVPLSYIIPRVCLWIYFGIVSVKHLVKVLFFCFFCFFLKEYWRVFSLIPHYWTTYVELKRNQIKIKSLLMTCFAESQPVFMLKFSQIYCDQS